MCVCVYLQLSVSFVTDNRFSVSMLPLDAGLEGPFLPQPPVFAFVFTGPGAGGGPEGQRIHGMSVFHNVSAVVSTGRSTTHSSAKKHGATHPKRHAAMHMKESHQGVVCVCVSHTGT